MFQYYLNTENSTLLVEEIYFSNEELLQIVDLNNEESIKYIKFKNLNRKKEWLSVRYLLKKICKDDVYIKYDNRNKPFLTNKKYITITHSGNLAGIIISNQKEIGIDIEKISHKLYTVKHKFLNSEELDKAKYNINYLDNLTLFWCAKEVLFKIYNQGELIFDKHIVIEKVDYKNQKIKAYININNKKEYELSFLKVGNYYLVWKM